jgi:hypothetical protein
MNNQKNKPANIGCEEAVKRFNSFIDNYLNGKAKDELIHHIKSCSHCFERLDFEQMLKSKIALILSSTQTDVKRAEKKMHNILNKIYKIELH